jgi:ABC-type enterochelin transport system substrate-binding protein
MLMTLNKLRRQEAERRNKSRWLENAFLPLLTAMEKDGKKIIYLDCDYYYSRGGMEANDKFTTQTYMVFDLPLGMVTLR